MAVCEVCGNDYWGTFEVRTAGGATHVFDSFECAITRLGPVCEHCSCKIVGHGAEIEGRFFCSAHCARAVDTALGPQLRDAVGEPIGARGR
jgi:hypothetical protein